MEHQQCQKNYKRIEELDEDGVATLLQQWDLEDFVEFTREKQIDGRRLLEISEGIVKLWKPKINAKKLIQFVEQIKLNPYKYLSTADNNKIEEIDKEDNPSNIVEKPGTKEANDFEIESQYQTIPIRKKEERTTTTTMNTVEELIRKIVPAKSFLYRNQQRAEKTPTYLPMDSGATKKKKLFRLSSYEYPFLEIRSRFSRQESSNDRGYYSMKRNSRYSIAKPYKNLDSKPKYKSLATPEELNEKYPEDHFYEDLCYNEVENVPQNSVPAETRVITVKPYKVKIQELFQSFKVPFFKRPEMIEDKEVKEDVKETNLYENSEDAANMYDSVHVNRQASEERQIDQKLQVEDYLEPVQLSKDYCDIKYQQQKEESLLGYILSIFENRFGIRRETTDDQPSSDSDTEHKTEIAPTEEVRKWPEDRKPTNMADRPLPVPVENEPYYMNIDRGEALNLLKGQADGTFVLRPSSQPDHAYTLSVSCANTVHNVGVRRRPDGRLALGFARRGEHSFGTVTSLLRHHKKRRILLVAGGDVLGATTLNEYPHYYQSPSSIPVPIMKE